MPFPGMDMAREWQVGKGKSRHIKVNDCVPWMGRRRSAPMGGKCRGITGNWLNPSKQLVHKATAGGAGELKHARRKMGSANSQLSAPWQAQIQSSPVPAPLANSTRSRLTAFFSRRCTQTHTQTANSFQLCGAVFAAIPGK